MASLAFVRSPANSPHKRPVTRKICPFDDVIVRISHRKGTAHRKQTRLNRNILRELHSQYHGCRCLGFLRRQVINSHGIDYVGLTSPCFPCWLISATLPTPEYNSLIQEYNKNKQMGFQDGNKWLSKWPNPASTYPPWRLYLYSNI